MSDDPAWMKECVRDIMIRNADARLISHRTEETLSRGTVFTTYHLTKEGEDALTLRLKPKSANSLVREVPVTPKPSVLREVRDWTLFMALILSIVGSCFLVAGIAYDRWFKYEHVIDCGDAYLSRSEEASCNIALDAAELWRQELADHERVMRAEQDKLDREDRVRRAYIAAPGETEEHRAKRFHNFWTEKFK